MHEQRLVDVLQARVDLVPVLGLIDHPAHLVADDVAGDEDSAGAAHVQRTGEARVVSGVDLQAVDQRQFVAFACLTPSTPSIWASSRSRSVGMFVAVRPGML